MRETLESDQGLQSVGGGRAGTKPRPVWSPVLGLSHLPVGPKGSGLSFALSPGWGDTGAPEVYRAFRTKGPRGRQNSKVVPSGLPSPGFSQSSTNLGSGTKGLADGIKVIGHMTLRQG